VKAVNLLPAESGRVSGQSSRIPLAPGYAVLALLGVALGFVTIYVLTGNTISQRKAKLASLQQQVSQEQALASRLNQYAQFAKLAQQRAATVRQIASTRFDWHMALADLSRVVPADTSLQSLLGTAAPGASVSGPGGSTAGSAASTGSLRGAIAAPAFEIKGCTRTQDDVARLLSRLRLINGVTQVTLADSAKPEGAQAASTAVSGSGATTGCGSNMPSFDLVVFFSPLPQGGSATTGSPTSQPASTTPPPSTTTTGGSK
jgi:Tfp pilus assembly protein PilN